MADLSGVWRRSSLCANGSCVEVAVAGNRVALRSSEDPAVILQFDEESWMEFLTGARNGDFDRAQS